MARYDLGLTSDEFYALQPRQLHALIRRWERAREHQEFMLAQIASTVANYSMGAPKKRLAVTEFMPSQRNKKPARKSRMRNRKVIALEVEAAMEAAMAYQAHQGRRR